MNIVKGFNHHLKKRKKRTKDTAGLWTTLNQSEVFLLFGKQNLYYSDKYIICRFYTGLIAELLHQAGYDQENSVSLVLPDLNSNPIKFKLWRSGVIPNPQKTKFYGYAKDDDSIKIFLDLFRFGFEITVVNNNNAWCISSVDKIEQIYLIYKVSQHM